MYVPREYCDCTNVLYILFILVLGGGKCHLSNSCSHFENDMKNIGKKLKPVKV